MTTILDLPIDLAILAACKASSVYCCEFEAISAASYWRDLPPHCLGWAAAFAPGLSESDREVLADASGSADFWRGMAGVYAPDVSPAWRERMIAESNQPDFWRGMAAAYAPDVSPDWRERMIAASNRPDYWRGVAGVYAPGVSPAWRERMIAASNDPERWRGEAPESLARRVRVATHHGGLSG